jgi:glycerol-1-phosphate dehydrogenase [NAD(P)+]
VPEPQPRHAAREVAIPRLLHVGRDSLAAVGSLVAVHGFDTTTVLVGTGAGPSRAFGDAVAASLTALGVEVVQQTGLTGELHQAAELASTVISRQVSLAVAVGGGRVIDTVKLAAARTGTELVSVPTTIAHDGISSPVASLQVDGMRTSFAAKMPAGIVVDTDVIGRAPSRTLRAGVGDLVSNLTAIADWQLADAAGQDRFDAYSALIAESAARPILDVGNLDVGNLGAPADHELLAKGLLLSGLAMAAAGTSRPCSGAEHLVSHSLDRLLGERAALHGEQVALGCLVSAAAHESPLLEQLRELFGRLGLPVAPEDIGILFDEMAEAVRQAPATRPDRYTVLSSLDLSGDAVEHLLKAAFA